MIDSYKIFRQLEERQKRANPYKFYDKDELIDEILKFEDKIEKTNWWLKEMLKQAKNNETKAIINGTLELLLDDDKEIK